MDEVRRDTDDELCGFVEQRDGVWSALVVFGAELGRHETHDGAVAHVRTDGLAALSDRWKLRSIDGDDQVVCIQEATTTEVTLALDHYSMPGVPTMTITSAELADGTWTLHR